MSVETQGARRADETVNGRRQAAGRGETAALLAAAEGLAKCGEVRAPSRAPPPAHAALHVVGFFEQICIVTQL